MKKIYLSPVSETTVLLCSPLLDGPGGSSMFTGSKQAPEDPFGGAPGKKTQLF